jgi:hypothetical protein
MGVIYEVNCVKCGFSRGNVGWHERSGDRSRCLFFLEGGRKALLQMEFAF